MDIQEWNKECWVAVYAQLLRRLQVARHVALGISVTGPCATPRIAACVGAVLAYRYYSQCPLSHTESYRYLSEFTSSTATTT
jgi:hypothetical protein